MEKGNTGNAGSASDVLMILTKLFKLTIGVLFTTLILWFATIGVFIWYLNQYEFSGSVEQTGVYTICDGNGNAIVSDINDEQLKQIMEVVRDGMAEDN